MISVFVLFGSKPWLFKIEKTLLIKSVALFLLKLMEFVENVRSSEYLVYLSPFSTANSSKVSSNLKHTMFDSIGLLGAP